MEAMEVFTSTGCGKLNVFLSMESSTYFHGSESTSTNLHHGRKSTYTDMHGSFQAGEFASMETIFLPWKLPMAVSGKFQGHVRGKVYLYPGNFLRSCLRYPKLR